MSYYLIGGGLGLFSGLMLYFLALHHVRVRSEFDKKNIYKKIQNRKYALVWMLVTMLMFLVIAYCQSVNGHIENYYDCWLLIRIILFAVLAIDVSAVDILMRRIPNAILLGMLLLEAVNIGLNTWIGQDLVEQLFQAIIGAAIAYGIFSLPMAFKLTAGMGDVKYSVLLGFMLGAGNFFEAMAVMSIMNLLVFFYLVVVGKGNLKTAVPMAPLLSTGAMVALLAPIF